MEQSHLHIHDDDRVREDRTAHTGSKRPGQRILASRPADVGQPHLGSAPVTAVVGLDLGHRSVAEAEHWLAWLPPVPGLLACTHLVHGPRPRVVVTLAAPGGIEAMIRTGPHRVRAWPDDRGAESAAADHAARRAGRAVRYPGAHAMTGAMSVADLLAISAIEHVQVLGSTESPTPDTIVDTRDFVRPQWIQGRLTLVAAPAPGGRIAPFEGPAPTPCCGGHG